MVVFINNLILNSLEKLYLHVLIYEIKLICNKNVQDYILPGISSTYPFKTDFLNNTL